MTGSQIKQLGAGITSQLSTMRENSTSMQHEHGQTAVTLTVQDEEKKVLAREKWFKSLIHRHGLASGTKTPPDRAAVLLRMLHEDRYPRALAQRAERWILKGYPCIKGEIRYADFYPRDEDLEKLGDQKGLQMIDQTAFSLDTFKAGSDYGYHLCRQHLRENAEYRESRRLWTHRGIWA